MTISSIDEAAEVVAGEPELPKNRAEAEAQVDAYFAAASVYDAAGRHAEAVGLSDYAAWLACKYLDVPHR